VGGRGAQHGQRGLGVRQPQVQDCCVQMLTHNCREGLWVKMYTLAELQHYMLFACQQLLSGAPQTSVLTCSLQASSAAQRAVSGSCPTASNPCDLSAFPT
jgi:hypothetical protein